MKKWKPKIGETYYYLHQLVKVCDEIFDGFACEEQFVRAGNCFKTKKEANNKLKQIKKILRSK